MARKSRIRSPQQLKPGVVLPGGYEIVRKIAIGGTAWIFEARHLESMRRVAIKVLNDHYRSDPSVVKRFANEARAAMALESPHVVRIEHVGRLSGGLPFLVIEYLDGADLYQVLKDAGWRLPLENALYVVDQVARAMEAAHAKGIVHRDLKPENVFLIDTPEGVLVKVLDFGLSRIPQTGSMSGLTKTGTTVGTPHYMALEQLRGDKSIDGRADVYALGVLTYELLSGHCPFEGDDPQDVMLRAAREEAPPLGTYRPDLPEALREVIAGAMERNRDKRIPTARAFREAIRPFWSGESPGFGADAAVPGIEEKAPSVSAAAPSQPPPETATRTPIPVALPPHPHAAARVQSRATVVAVLLAALVLAVGLTCFIVDTVRGTPGSTALIDAQPNPCP